MAYSWYYTLKIWSIYYNVHIIIHHEYFGKFYCCDLPFIYNWNNFLYLLLYITGHTISFLMLHDGIWFHLRIVNVFGMIWNSNQTIQEEHYKKSRKWWFDLTCVVWYQHRKLFWTLRAWLPLSIVCIQIIIFVYLMRYMFSSNHYSI